MTKAEYIDGVLLRMNEATQSGISSIIGSDTTQVSSFIEKTFTETPDEAIRRYENSVSGDVDMAAQTMFGDSRSEQATAA